MSWEDQGRQSHGYFGSGTAPPKSQPTGRAIGDRIDSLAHSLVAHLPRSDRNRLAVAFDGRSLDSFMAAVLSWAASPQLARDDFRQRLLPSSVSDETVDLLRAASEGVTQARTIADETKAGVAMARAVQQIGLSRWQRFVADAAQLGQITGGQVIFDTRRPALSSSADTDAIIDAAGPAAPPPLTPAGEALRLRLAAISREVVREYTATTDYSKLSRLVMGTRLHTMFANAVRDLHMPNVTVEESFAFGDFAQYGFDGSVRTDVVLREGGNVTAIFDYKTGKVADDYSALSGKRTQILLYHVLGPGVAPVPVVAIRVKVRD